MKRFTAGFALLLATALALGLAPTSAHAQNNPRRLHVARFRGQNVPRAGWA
jgi:hypothetical protein